MSEEQTIRSERIAKVEALRALGQDPYALEKYSRTHSAADIAAHFDQLETHDVAIAGRLVQQRIMGKAAFINLLDGSGRIQVYVRKDDVGEEEYERFKDLDIGDIVGVNGFVFKTRTGEISVHARSYTLLAKCLRPLPIGKEGDDGEQHSALSDTEHRQRMRYLDVLANPEARETLVKRCRLVTALRRLLDDQEFLEVETPVLLGQAGGAAARPFMTHHNAFDHDFKLRIALELYLKRLIVGGFEKVYEIGRVFRNEGISTKHSPEFTLLELYQAFADLDDIMDLTEEIFVAGCTAVNGEPRMTYHGKSRNGESAPEEVDFSRRPWRRLAMLDGIREYAGVQPEELTNLASAKAACERVGIPTEHENTVGGIIEKLHERFTQPHLVQPTFIVDFPIETSPFAKKRSGCPGLVRRFEVYALTQELGNAFSEINDPLEQRERFENQVKQREAGDDEAHPMDEDFLRAMEYGMPPTGGLGIGIDRLAMVLSSAASIRDVIMFPLLKPIDS